MRISATCRATTLVAITGLLLGCSHSGQVPHPAGQGASEKSGEVILRVAPVHPERKTLVRRTEQPGQIEAFEQTALYAKATGFVSRFLVDIGDRVKGPVYDDAGKLVSEGQVLAELSIPELDAEVNQRRAVVAQTASEVKQSIAAVTVAEAALSSAEAKLAESQAGVERDKAQYDRWKSEFTRISDLADKGAVTRKVQDETESQLRAADSSRRESAAKVRSAEAVVTEGKAMVIKAKADHEATDSRLQVAQADQQRVEALQSYATIRAPLDGTISARHVNTGDLVQSGLSHTGPPLFVVVRTDVVRIFVDVPEADAVLTQANNEAVIKIPAMANEAFKGAVTRSAWVLDPTTRTLRTEIDLKNAEGKLRPGMYAYADIKVAERTDAMSLPKSAVLRNEGQAYCLTVDSSHKLIKTPIVTGIQTGTDVEIVAGLDGKEAVIATNAASYREGQAVEIAQKKAATSP